MYQEQPLLPETALDRVTDTALITYTRVWIVHFPLSLINVWQPYEKYGVFGVELEVLG